MELDFTPFFEEYEELLAQADKIFAAVAEKFPECVKCHKGCSDCCYAMFDLTLIEALYVNHHARRLFEGEPMADLLERANRADRKAYQVKKEAFQAAARGKETGEVLSRVAWERVRCPLLGQDDRCIMYEHRPITCRFYGIPTSIGGESHTCGKSGFEEGAAYPTVSMEAIHKRLFDISARLVARLRSRYVKMEEVLVPVSMALLTVYDEEYLGLKKSSEDAQPNPAEDPAP